MKQLLILFALAIVSNSIIAQKAEAVIFSEAGEKFTLYLNGIQINEEPTNNVVASDLDMEGYQVRADFEDSSLPDMTANMMVKFGMKATYKIKLNRKGKYVLRYFSESAMGTPAKAEPVVMEEQVNTRVAEEPAKVQSTMTTTTTTSTVDTPDQSDSEEVKMSIAIDGLGMDVDMSVEGISMEVESSSEMTQSTTVTTTTVEETVIQAEPVEEVISGRCAAPVSDSEFNDFMQGMNAKTFADSKMIVAKQFTQANCVTSKQVSQVMKAFDFEDDRLDFAKFAHDYTFDQHNYYMVNEAFQFEMTIEELDQYIQSK